MLSKNVMKNCVFQEPLRLYTRAALDFLTRKSGIYYPLEYCTKVLYNTHNMNLKYIIKIIYIIDLKLVSH